MPVSPPVTSASNAAPTEAKTMSASARSRWYFTSTPGPYCKPRADVMPASLEGC